MTPIRSIVLRTKTPAPKRDNIASDMQIMPLDYRDKLILAPMVRIGTLPFRLLALEYEADLVYTEELVDLSLLKCQRFLNPVLGTVDFRPSLEEDVILRIHPEKEKGKVVLQMGTCDPVKAVQVAKLVEQDVAAIDINMGCPKPFSVHSGMGAALLRNPEKVEAILSALVTNLNIPVTCKIRILPDMEKTMALAERIQGSGVAALAVHGRTEEQRSRTPNDDAAIAAIAHRLTIPIIANGGSNAVESREAAWEFGRKSGAASVMLARAAMWNPSIFRKDGPLPLEEVTREYLKLAIAYESDEPNVKYVFQRMFKGDMVTTELGRKLKEAVTIRQMADILGIGNYYTETISRIRERRAREERWPPSTSSVVEEEVREFVASAGSPVLEAPFRIPRKKLDNSPGGSPKNAVYHLCLEKGWPKPVYKTMASVLVDEREKVDGIEREKSRAFAESASALVALDGLRLRSLVQDWFWDQR